MMFDTRWRDSDANSYIKRHPKQGTNAEIALRVYTSQLIGSDPDLVMHGGGNTSCKSTMPDFFGNNIRVLCVKGSGWDLGTIEAAGLPAVKLEPLLELRQLDALRHIITSNRLQLSNTKIMGKLRYPSSYVSIRTS